MITKEKIQKILIKGISFSFIITIAFLFHLISFQAAIGAEIGLIVGYAYGIY